MLKKEMALLLYAEKSFDVGKPKNFSQQNDEAKLIVSYFICRVLLNMNFFFAFSKKFDEILML